MFKNHSLRRGLLSKIRIEHQIYVKRKVETLLKTKVIKKLENNDLIKMAQDNKISIDEAYKTAMKDLSADYQNNVKNNPCQSVY